MSNETKRDVFGQLLNAYQNLSMKDIQIPDENYRENITTPWNIVYDAALPDDMPVIPKAVGEYIRWCKSYDGIHGISEALYYATESNRKWIYRAKNSDVFARAWLLGVWRLEETGEIVKLEAEK
ncbi:hypothetical protein [Lacticaseibacillus paracasei]|uniref:hypothetical protein n=1 Tax=Lacticaseibacillus paracasei TaxID=1597 RepID=UPI0040458831